MFCQNGSQITNGWFRASTLGFQTPKLFPRVQRPSKPSCKPLKANVQLLGHNVHLKTLLNASLMPTAPLDMQHPPYNANIWLGNAMANCKGLNYINEYMQCCCPSIYTIQPWEWAIPINHYNPTCIHSPQMIQTMIFGDSNMCPRALQVWVPRLAE